MATCTRVESGKMPDGKTRYVWYEYDDGSVVIRLGGSRSWRNNNPGNVVRGPGRIGKDAEGFAIFPDLPKGAAARKTLFVQGGKYYGYDSLRQVIKGKFNEKGQQIPGTGYAPRFNAKGEVENDPDAYADFVGQYIREYYRTKYNRQVDIENIKIRDYTPEMLDVLEKAQTAREGFSEGKVFRYDPTGRLVGYPADESSRNNVTVSPRQGRQASTQAGGHLRPDLAERPERLSAIDHPMWGQNAPPAGSNQLTDNALLSRLPAPGNQPGGYYAHGVAGQVPAEQPTPPSAGYPAAPLPFDSPLYPRRNLLLEPMQLDRPFGAGSMGQGGQPGPAPNRLLGPWPGFYPPGRENLLFPDLERLLERYFIRYPSTSGTRPPDRSGEQ